ncbi:MAG: acyl-CoA dehydrogenase family protein [Panacagrimonas sp.]
MDFSFSSEQELLQDSAARFALKGYGFDQYKHSLEAPGQCDPAIWKQLADFGWLALPVAETAGGIGGSTLDMALVAESLGAGLVIEPYLTGLVLPALILGADTSSTTHAHRLEAMISGDTQLAVAYTERAGRFDSAHCATRAEKTARGYRINGAKHCVFNAPNASELIVTARTSGQAGDTAGIELFLLPREAAGLMISSYPVLGGGVAADLVFDDLEVGADAALGLGLDTLDAALDTTTTLSCAQALGGMKALFERTAAYLRTRKQFGVPIGSFQILQHRLVDMFIELEQSRSMVLMAAGKCDTSAGQIRRRAVSAAKAYVGKSSKFVAQQAVQLHGGIGVTEELDVGHYFRQLTAFGTRFGDRDFHLSRFEALVT